MESKITTEAGNIYEKWQAFEKQPSIEYFEGINKSTGKKDRKWKYEANRTLGQPPFSPGHAAEMQDQAMAEASKPQAAARANTLSSLFSEAMQLRDISTKPEHAHNYKTSFMLYRFQFDFEYVFTMQGS